MTTTHKQISDRRRPARPAIDAATRERTLATFYRCIDRILRRIANEHRSCGKATCARSHRCRGQVCVRKRLR